MTLLSRFIAGYHKQLLLCLRYKKIKRLAGDGAWTGTLIQHP